MAYAMTNSVSTAGVVAGTETTVSVLPAVPYYPTGNYQGMAITGAVNILNNTSTTTVLKVKTGATTAGTLVGALTVATTSVGLLQLPFAVLDTTNPPSSQYNLTVTCSSGTGTATTNSVYLQMDPVIV